LDLYQQTLVRYNPPKKSTEEESTEKESTEESFEEYDTMPILFYSVFHHATNLASNYNLTSRGLEFYKKAFELNPDLSEVERYQVILIQDLFGLGMFDKADKAIETAYEKHGHSIVIQFFKGVLLKFTDRKKEGNKILRAIDTDRTDPTQFAHEINNFCNMLRNNGKEELAKMVIQEASR
jgi:tetratricopeptide (TPR) repeat protein